MSHIPCERCGRTDMPALLAGVIPMMGHVAINFCAPCLNGLRHGWIGPRVANFPPFGEGVAPRHVALAAAMNPCQS